MPQAVEDDIEMVGVGGRDDGEGFLDGVFGHIRKGPGQLM